MSPPADAAAGDRPAAQAAANLLADLPPPAGEEIFQTLFANPACRIERIVSYGHATPPGQWYDQDDDEWVALLCGEAVLLFADGETLALTAGDWVGIPARRRHRVDAVSTDAIWLAVHCRAGAST